MSAADELKQAKEVLKTWRGVVARLKERTVLPGYTQALGVWTTKVSETSAVLKAALERANSSDLDALFAEPVPEELQKAWKEYIFALDQVHLLADSMKRKFKLVQETIWGVRWPKKTGVQQ